MSSTFSSSSSSSSQNMALPSLCIPRVFKNITRERIMFVFKSLGLGEIDRIDLVQKTTEAGQEFQRVFIHFKQWGTSAEAVKARERIMAGKEIKIVYDDPWFWKVSMNRSVVRQKPADASAACDFARSNRGPPRRRALPRMEISTDEDDNEDKDEALLVRKVASQKAASADLQVPTTPRDDPPDLEAPPTPRKVQQPHEDPESLQEEAGVMLNYEGANMTMPAKRVRVPKKLSVPPPTLQRSSSQYDPDYELGC